MTLYELTGEFLQLQEMLEAGEDEELINDTLESVEYDLEEKAEGYAKIIRNLEADIAALKDEEKRLKQKRNTIENNVARLKSNLQEAMILTNKRKFKHGVFTFQICKNGGALPVVLDMDIEKIPAALTAVTVKPDLKKIADYLNEHPKSKIAHFGDRGERLRIR